MQQTTNDKMGAGRDSAPTAPAIRASGITQIFGAEDDAQRVVALDHVSIDVRRGELLCLIGPSGCGKSTLLNIMGGLLQQTDGEVRIGDQVVEGPMPGDVAFVFQESALFPWNTVVENVMVALEF